ncbi:hypothetical protein [Nocardioides sambongensis]|nr:hypothetical protein [Nocardioides sambongensis]
MTRPLPGAERVVRSRRRHRAEVALARMRLLRTAPPPPYQR